MSKIIYIINHCTMYMCHSLEEMTDKVSHILNIDYTVDKYNANRKDVEQENEVYPGAFVLANDDSLSIVEYQFDESESISLMRCYGPSSECCFVVKKSKVQFWMESLAYMKETIDVLQDNCEVSITRREYPKYNTITVSLTDENLIDVDMMHFVLIYNFH